MLPIIAVLSVFGTSGFVMYLFFSTRHKERIALIENGADAKIFNESLSPLPNLKWGMFLVAIGLAVFAGYALEEYTQMSDEVGYVGLILLFGGISLLIYYRYVSRNPRTDI